MLINAEIGVEVLAALQAASMQTWVVSIPWGRESALAFEGNWTVQCHSIEDWLRYLVRQ